MLPTLAKLCRAATLHRFSETKTSCIESAAVLARAAELLGRPLIRMVCQVAAYSPGMTERIKQGLPLESELGKPGMWSVGIGLPRFDGDYVGRLDTANNRFVGHVVCLSGTILIDPSIDQLNRPAHDLILESPIVMELDADMLAEQVGVGETPSGILLKYVLHPDVVVPEVKMGKVVERLAQGVVRDFSTKHKI